MSDGRDRGAGPPVPTIPPVTTVPLAAQPMQRAVTQMSASAIPSTLESPKDPLVLRAQAQTNIEHVAQAESDKFTATLDDFNGTTLPDDAARDAAIREAAKQADARSAANPAAVSAHPFTPRHGPPTMMSPTPGASGLPGPTSARGSSESAVVDAVLPAAAFLPMETLDMGVPRAPSLTAPNYAPIGAGPHAQWGAPGAHPGAFDGRDGWQAQPIGHAGPPMGSLPPAGMGVDPRVVPSPARRSSTTLIVVCIVAAVILLLAVAGVAGGAYVFKQRKEAAKAAQGSPSSADSAATSGAPPVNAPIDARLMSGTKARISTLSAGTLDGEAVRTALTAVLPRIDACYAASELEPPNHETAAYDLDVAAAGTVTRAEPSSAAGRAPKLDACVGNALRTAKLPKSASGTKVKLTLTSRIGDPR